MKLEGEQVLLRIHLSNFVRWHGQPLYEALVLRARKLHMSGATVLTGIAGYFGDHPVMHHNALSLQAECPVVVEIVDSEEALERFLDDASAMLEGHAAIVTIERAHVVHYRSGSAPS